MQAGLFYARLHAGPVAKELAPVTTDIYLTPRDPIVGAGLPAMTPCQPTAISLTPPPSQCGSGLAREGGLAGDTVGLCTYPLLR